MDVFNLNTDDYSKTDIEKLLGLKEKYTLDDIHESKKVLLKQIVNNEDIEIDKTETLIFFLDTITEILSNTLTNTKKNNFEDNLNSTIQHGSNILINDKKDNIELNQIKVNKIYKSINIDSKFRTNLDVKSTNYDFTLQEKLNKITTITITDINIPLSFYNVDEYKQNNSILFTTDKVNNTNNKKYGFLLTVPDGNYNDDLFLTKYKTSIETIIKSSINNAKKGEIDPSSGNFIETTHNLSLNDISYNINDSNNKSEFTDISNTNYKITNINFNITSKGMCLNNTNIQNTLGWLLGFRKMNYDLSSETKLESESLCMMNYYNYGYISINDYQTNYYGNIIAFNNDTIIDKNIIAKTNFNQESNTQSFFQNDENLLSHKREYFGPVDIQRLSIALYDEHGRIIDLNNQDWSFTLIIEQLY